MNDEQQLEWEARAGKLAGAAGIASAFVTLGSVAVQATTGGSSENERETLERVADHKTQLLASVGLQTLAVAFVAVALIYLLRVTIARRSPGPRFAIPLVVIAPVLLGVGTVLINLDLGSLADRYLESGPRTLDRAKDLLEDRSVLGAGLGAGGTLALAVSYVIVSINAQRAGLLNSFMTILGCAVGALLIFPLLPGAAFIVQIAWVAALGVLFLGIWPGGRGPAWATVEDIPWPSASRVAREAAAERKVHEAAQGDPGAGTVDGERAPERPASLKRKRKRRG